MTHRDAFGRPIERSGPTIKPLGPPGPGLGGVPSPEPGRRPRSGSSGLRRFLWMFVVFDLVAIGVVAAILVAGRDDDTVVLPSPAPATPSSTNGLGSNSTKNQSDDPLSKADDGQPAKLVTPAGLNATSLLRPSNLERAINRAHATGQGARPMMVRVQPDRVDLQLARPDGAMVLMQIPAGGPPTVVTTVAGAARGRPTMLWSAIEPLAPQRLARATRSTSAAGPSSAEYVVLLAQTHQWVLYRKNGVGYIADETGRGGMRIPGT